MKLFVVFLGLVSSSYAYVQHETNYHETIGIPEAARIKAMEESIDFDGSRIAGGSHARLGQYPHMGGLLITVPQGTSVCGSSLISNTRLVTAAHCWFDGQNQASQFTVVLGSITLFTGGHRVNTNRIIMHPEWNYRTIRNDVAVIQIAHVAFTTNINRINLATGNNLYVGQWANAVGFGLKGDNVNIAPNQPLSHVNVQIIANDVCRRTLIIVQSTNICISGANGRSTCRGDSGGPLSIGNTLVGITSFGAAAGCQRGHPAAFARVTSYATWLSRQ